MAEGADLAMAQIVQDWEDLPNLQPRQQDTASHGLNRHVGSWGDASTPSSSLDSVYKDDTLLPTDLLSSVDKKLISVFGDTVHDNDESYLNRNIEDYGIWQ
eukprot:15323575-Ditylum_brightwellii.AAC.1